MAKSARRIGTRRFLYGRSVVRDIISLAVKEVAGVHSLQGKGVRTFFSGETIVIDVYIMVGYGDSVPDTAYHVQENIKRAVETMTEYKIETINVGVLGVNFAGA